MRKAKVNGVEVAFEPGVTALQVAELTGEGIPRFRHHARLSIAGDSWKPTFRRVIKRLAALVLLGAALSGAANAQTAPADPYAAQRPTAESVPGVTMPAEYTEVWMQRTYIAEVTLFATLPSLEGRGVAFVGDSITDAGRWAEAYPDLRVRNFGISGDTTAGLMHRSAQIAAAKPARIFLMIGTNDLRDNIAPETVAANVSTILDGWKRDLPGTRVYVQSLLPRQPEFDARVRDVNTRLRKVAADHGARYVDLYPSFVTGDRLDPSVTLDDLHLTGGGYVRWRRIIRACVYGSSC